MTQLKNPLGIQPTNTRQYKPKPLRRLKVRESYYEYQLKQHYFERTPIAEIKLKGRWLVAAGFSIDTPVTVQIEQGKLVITAQ